MFKRLKIVTKLPQIEADMIPALESAIRKSTIYIHNKLISEKLLGNRSGKSYPLPGSPKKKTVITNKRGNKQTVYRSTTRYTASAPGEAPASRSADLRTRYKWLMKQEKGLPVGYVGNPEPYAKWLEDGTRKMAKRPHLQPTMKKYGKYVTEKYFKDFLQ